MAEWELRKALAGPSANKVQVADIQKLMPDEFNRKLKEWELMKISSPGNERCAQVRTLLIILLETRQMSTLPQIVSEAVFGLLFVDCDSANRRRRSRRRRHGREEEEDAGSQEEKQQQRRWRVRQVGGQMGESISPLRPGNAQALTGDP